MGQRITQITHFINLTFSVQFHPCLPGIEGILQAYIHLLHQSVNVKTIVSDLHIASFKQTPNLRHSLCRAKLLQPPSVID